MSDTSRKTLVVIGAGPKGIAVAVKAKVMEEFDVPVDRVVLIERHSVGAHWSGEVGYTNGDMKLGTSPEKDVVFPIETDVGNEELNQKIRQRLVDFSWISYLVQGQKYADWVDRGRPSPTHQLWSRYLKWVSKKLLPQVEIISAEVKSIEICNEQWVLHLSGPRECAMVADGLMLTGPGKTRKEFDHQDVACVYDLESFWCALKNDKFKLSGRLAIVGAGENAASVLLALSKMAPGLEIDVISPKGFISTRAENYYENRFYSHPRENGWDALELTDRTDFIRRTDLGVFSVEAMKTLNQEDHHTIVPGRLVSLVKHLEEIRLDVGYAGKVTSRQYDQVILATGFDQAQSLISFFSEELINGLEAQISAPLTQEELGKRIEQDLSVDGIRPKLHLPMLAGINQGPGFANLSCLGNLSDRILIKGTRL
ncbi:MAG TPA: SidA/IucD/PvdA family monooxygenase [Bacteriovoracaceae bacterium]|nr:SidA/IucD/PvdA family monooxygenase [Bacteriovoracaceae bacterium]